MAVSKISFIIISISFIQITNGFLNFTHMKCLDYDLTFSKVEICVLNYMLKYNYYTIDLYTKLYKIPVHNVSVSFFNKNYFPI